MTVLRLVRRHPDVLVALFVVALVATLIVPLPPWLLDGLLVLDVALGLTLLVGALYAARPLAVTGFPTLLLLATLFRLALNVSSTRLILGTASAGEVIEAFGDFVVQGNYLVGAVVFLILTLVQFLVVAKGAERVAEVGARFTLDALPGKQLSIDADIRAGALTQAEGQARRRDLERESQFYGALDGAMKFVKGDAVAGLLITGINVLGGLTAGVVMEGMAPGEALSRFVLLSIGDGLVSTIPALLAAVAAGLVVTRVGGREEGPLAAELLGQLSPSPKGLAVVGVVLVALGLVPGLPLVPFTGLGLLVGGGAVWRLTRGGGAEGETAGDGASADAGAGARMLGAAGASGVGTAGGAAALGVGTVGGPTALGAGTAGGPTALGAGPAPVVLELGEAVDPRWVAEHLRPRLAAGCTSLAERLGLPLPDAAVALGRGAGRAWRLLVQDVPVADGELPEGPVLALSPGEAAFFQLEGTPRIHAGREALEVAPETAERARALGLEVLAPEDTVLGPALSALGREVHALLSVERTQSLLDRLERRAPTVVREASRRVPVPVLCDVLRHLLEEGVGLRWLERILESLAGAPEGLAEAPGGALRLAERARQALGAQLVAARSESGSLPVLVMDPILEDLLRDGLAEGPEGPVMALAPMDHQRILEALQTALANGPRTLLVASELRRWVWRAASETDPEITVLGYQELPARARVRPLGRISLPDAALPALAATA